MMNPRLTIIAAVAANGVIGRAGGLPWRLPDDLKRFKALTLGHAMIMGRRTYDSLGGRPLPNRRIIVVSRTMGGAPAGIALAGTLDDAVQMAQSTPGPIFIAGGGVLYEAALPYAGAMELTEIEAEVEGDAYFPRWDRSQWELVGQVRHEADEKHSFPFRFSTYRRIG